MKIQSINKVIGTLLILLTISVAIPLTIKTVQTAGGSWGFSVIGLPILLPLCTYFFTGITSFIKKNDLQRKFFVSSQILTLATGIISFIIFPVLPVMILIVPIFLSILGIADKPRQQYYLMFMIILPIVANILLLKWEMDFGRTFPIMQLF